MLDHEIKEFLRIHNLGDIVDRVEKKHSAPIYIDQQKPDIHLTKLEEKHTRSTWIWPTIGCGIALIGVYVFSLYGSFRSQQIVPETRKSISIVFLSENQLMTGIQKRKPFFGKVWNERVRTFTPVQEKPIWTTEAQGIAKLVQLRTVRLREAKEKIVALLERESVHKESAFEKELHDAVSSFCALDSRLSFDILKNMQEYPEHVQKKIQNEISTKLPGVYISDYSQLFTPLLMDYFAEEKSWSDVQKKIQNSQNCAELLFAIQDCQAFLQKVREKSIGALFQPDVKKEMFIRAIQVRLEQFLFEIPVKILSQSDQKIIYQILETTPFDVEVKQRLEKQLQFLHQFYKEKENPLSQFEYDQAKININRERDNTKE